MGFNFKRLLHTSIGKGFISIMLGLGLASLFRKVCKDKDCIVFSGPVISEIQDKTFKYGKECYTYTPETAPCDSTRRTVETAERPKKNNDLKNIYGH
jgi:hypothetical protein